jgi:L-amino acid N-acyltransferase YncA
VTQEFEDRECQARIAEAELMAMLDGESARSIELAQKAQREQEGRRRQQQTERAWRQLVVPSDGWLS